MLERILDKFFKEDGVFFIGSSDILPPPLLKDEEEDLVRKSNSGDLVARNKLIEHNLRLVVFLAKKYDDTMYDLEDLVSIGTIGLIKAIKTYKLDKNIKLATYASRCIDNEILMFLRKNKKRNSEVSFEDSINFDSEGNELHIEDVFGTLKRPMLVDDDKLVSDNGATNGKKYYYYKYTDMSQNAKKMMWADTYMGAIRPSWSKDANGRDQLPANFTPHFYTNGTLNFTGMLISRFGDINADAGTRDAVSKKRVNQLGYVNQFLDFDSNILNNCPPYFSMTNQNYWQSTSALTWNILSYVDRGSLNN